jgi:hypothetical protein
MDYYLDWRRNGCTGFTESAKGCNHAFTILLDAHPDLEADCKLWITKKTKDRKGALTVAKFASALNTELVPAHKNLPSQFVNPKTGLTPYISHTVAWRFMVHLGAKYGSLHKGLVQDHERPDVVRVRQQFVSYFLSHLDRMMVYRRVNIPQARQFAAPAMKVEAKAGKEKEFVESLRLPRVKEEDPTEHELAMIEKWAASQCASSGRTVIESCRQKEVIMLGDKFDFIGESTRILSQLQTKNGTTYKWLEGRMLCIDAVTKAAVSFDRPEDKPILVWMHDECIFRHKDVGRYGWSYKRMCSQRYKDDGSGRMISGFFSDLFGVLYVPDNIMAVINAKRRMERKLPIHLGEICAAPDDVRPPVDDADALLEKELTAVNTERATKNLPALSRAWGSSIIRFDYGRNREGYWCARHMLRHIDEFLDVLEHVFPDFQNLLVFDNSSGHGAFAEDALLSQRASKGWGGRQPKMRDTKWVDSSGNIHLQSCVFTEEDRVTFPNGPVSKCSQRLQVGEKEPDFVGCAKGAHQILYERSIVEAALVTGSSIPCAQRTARQQALFDFLEEEGRMDTTNPDMWNNECGSACKDDGRLFEKGCDDPIIPTDAEKRSLICCCYCANTYHAKCAGLCPTLRRMRDDWACPECVYVAEEALQFTPLHMTAAEALVESNRNLLSNATDPVQSEFEEMEIEPPSKGSLGWMRWRLAQEPDFKGEENMVQALIRKRGQLALFLPKFHCDLNWAENHWGKSKTCVRSRIDGTWMSMCQAIWVSFGHANISIELARKFARKIREIICMYDCGIDGDFATYCHRQFSTHRLPFVDAESMAKWEVGSAALARKTDQGKKVYFCTLTAVNHIGEMCSVKFKNGEIRDNISLQEIRFAPDLSVERRLMVAHV